jgi:hypothetical protein
MIQDTHFEDPNSPDLSTDSHNLYRQIIGPLIYLTTTVRPDIAFAVRRLSHHLANPKEIHMNGVIKIIVYIKKTRDYVIKYDGNCRELEIYADASHNVRDERHKSVTGVLVMFAGAPTNWISKRQSVISK